MELYSFSGARVDALYFKGTNDAFNAGRTLKESGIICYESDVIAEERYLMERFIYGSVKIEGESRILNGIKIYHNPRLIPTEYKPDFKILSIDIETGRDGSVYSIALHLTGNIREIKKVLMRGTFQESEYIEWFDSEKSMLIAFNDELSLLDPDIIIGWHVIGFDLEFLKRRYEFYSIPFRAGRDGSAPIIRQAGHGGWHCNINGRVVIDGPPTLRGAFYTYESYSLEFVATEVLGVGKDITGSGKVDEIERRFREDKVALARYNLLDTTLVTDIFNKLDLIDLTYTRAITSGMTMDRVGLSVASFDYFMLPLIHRKGLVAPDAADMIAVDQGKGGLVFNKEPGFYDSIVVLDFKSLYPSIIRTFKIDPYSRLNNEKDRVTTPVGVSFSKTENLLPDFIRNLMNKRADAKKDGNPHLSQSIKILMNSFYGVMGTPLSRFYHPDLSKAITGTGQWLLNLTKEYLENKEYNVIYGDTDSVFVQLKENQRTDFNKNGEALSAEINDFLKEKLQRDFNVDSELELEYEKHFRKFFLPGIRANANRSVKGAKKRYAGLLSKESGEELSFTGLEFVRSDWTKLAKNFQYDLFTLIFNNQEVDSYIKMKVKELKEGKLDEQLYYSKRLKKPASEYKKMVPPQVKASLLLDPSGHMRGKIEYIITVNGPIPKELKPDNIDYDHYIDKQLKPIADSVINYIGKSFENIVFNRQPELF